MTNKETQEIESKLKELEYIRVGGSFKDWWNGRIMGWNMYCSSVVRKRYTLNRLVEDIEEMNLPLIIKPHEEMTNHFKVYLNV